MAPAKPTVPVRCAHCAAPFTLTPRALARRRARYGHHLLCARCLADSWLDTWQGHALSADLLRDADNADALRAAASPDRGG